MFNRDILDYLAKWSKKSGRKPLVLRGARQVGKTFAVVFFAEQHFENFVHINLEKAEHYELFKETDSVAEFEKIAEVVLGTKIIAGKTLIFFDEIQNAPNLIALLRFFYEERPDLHVIAAGSLLEVKIKKEDLSMPVGRVEFAYVYPLTFFEFLRAVGENKLLDFLKKVTLREPIASGIHGRALKLFYEYTLVGGMPEAVALQINKSSREELNSFYSSLLTAYAEDIYKYSSSADVKYLRHVLEQAPYFAGERIIYEKFGGGSFRSREMGEAFGILEKTMIVRQIVATKSLSLPLVGQTKRAKKLLYLDSGLINYKNNIQAEYIKLEDLNNLYRGRAAEQIVGQNIIAGGLHAEQELFYWAKEKPAASAEVDFCLAHQGRIIGIEVKSGHSAKLKSLMSFAESVDGSKLIRIYSGQLKEETVSSNGKKHKLLSLPFYLVNRLFEMGK
ncbi:MAG: AAA family ATPase [Patescibacteria group bacterium]